METIDIEKQISLMFSINQQLVRRAIEGWDRKRCGSFPCYLLRFVHIYWKEIARFN